MYDPTISIEEAAGSSFHFESEQWLTFDIVG
jgi:hypothetical protein